MPEENEVITGFQLIKEMTKEELISEIMHEYRAELANHKMARLRVDVMNYRLAKVRKKLITESGMAEGPLGSLCDPNDGENHEHGSY